MAPRKRPLSEIDHNVTCSGPASEGKTKRFKTSEKPSDYEKHLKTTLVDMLRDRSLRVSGSKPALVQRLQEDDGKATSTKRKKTPKPKKDSSSKAEASKDEFDFRVICRPDLRYEDLNSDSDDIANAPKYHEHKRKLEIMYFHKLVCKCEDPAALHPGWPWLITRRARDIVAQFRNEVLLREAEMWDSLQYNDHSGYGFQEVVDDHLVTFNKEICKKNASPVTLWPMVEGFAFNLPDDRAYWFHIDDADGLCETLKILGVAVFSTLKILEEHDLLRPDSPVKNIALVLACLRRNMEDWPGYCGPEYPTEDELQWCDAAIVEAQHKGIEFKHAPTGIEDKLKKDAAWKRLNWNTEYKTYYNKHKTGSTLGGRQYVLAPQHVAKRLKETAKVAPRYLM